MADNGVQDQNVEVADFFDTDNDAKVNEVIQRIKSLELEKVQLVRVRDESNEKVGELLAEIDRLRSGELASKEKLKTMEGQIESADEGEKAMESILKRARELEIEVSRLQHELGSAMSHRVVAELKAVVEAKQRMVERLEGDVENLKTGKAENDVKVKDLESKIEVLEAREMERKSEQLWIESELKETIVEKEKEVGVLKNTFMGLQAVLYREASELKKWKKEKMGVKQALRESEKKAKELELKLVSLHGELERAGKVITELKEKTVETINGTIDGLRGIADAGDQNLKVQWPLVAVGSTGAVAAVAAMAYIIFSRHARKKIRKLLS